MAAYHAKKRLGQHFLTSQSVVDRIIGLLSPSAGQTIIEIGPGRGILTRPLVESGAEIVAIEFDEDVLGYLKKLLRGADNVRILNMDFLTFEPDPDRFPRFSLVGNLPFNITSPVLEWCARYHDRIDRAVFMIQREMAHRVAGTPGHKDWSPLAIFTQLYFDVTLGFDVSPKSFRPPPGVTSTVIALEPKKLPVAVEHPAAFETLVRSSFTQRRKLLRNNLMPHITSDADALDAVFEQLGLPATTRAEELSTEQFLSLTEALVTHNILPVHS